MEELSRKPGKNVNYVHVKNIENCASKVGMRGGMQILKLADKCFKPRGSNALSPTPSVMEHEFLHALGVYHEHSRPDR